MRRLNKKMVSFNFVLVISLLLSLNHSCDAYSIKGFKNAAEERNYEVERLGGRKFMLDRSQLMGRKLKVKKDEEIISTSSSTKNSSSGASSVGNSKHTTTLMKKREMKMEKFMINHQHDETKNINPSGFMALNADYHMARPHPPRNN